MPEVLLSERAAEWLEDAEPDLHDRIVSKLREASDRPGHFLKPLRDSSYYRVRVGKYRAIIDWDKSADQLLVLRIGHRDGVYR